MDLSPFDVVVVGAGFFGATIAERAARELGLKVCILERRHHVGGNSHSRVDSETGIEYHPYGSHLFHTSNEGVWAYLQRFAQFTDYRHRVFTVHAGRVYSMPINLGTISSFFGRYFSPNEARKLIETQVASEQTKIPTNLEDKAIRLIGRPLYEAFIRGYTFKQWQTDPRKLPADIITRLPVRFSFNDRYFADKYEGLPANGYHDIFKEMLNNKRITVFTDTDYFAVRQNIGSEQLLVYTGPIDRFYDYRAGRLGWRTLDFERDVLPVDDYQGTSVMNYADEDVPYTRIHEFKHLHPERTYTPDRTLIFREYSRSANNDSDEPFYPINTAADKAVYDHYRAMTERTANVLFGGRLGTYRYLDMHQAIGAALKAFERAVVPWFRERRPLKAIAVRP
ncbi:MAG: UDP-galactopyranose mutase [Defluviicoccus sp.]